MSYANATRNLQNAALAGDTEKLRGLLDSMPASAITKADKSGKNAIHLAASSGNASSIDILLKAGGNALKADNTGCSPMHFAAETGNEESVTLLAEAFKVLVRKADNEGNEPLHFAAEKGNLVTCRALLSVGAKVQARNSLGTTPLLLASMGGFVAVVKCLLESGAQCDTRDNSQRRTPLLEASAGAHERVAEQLIAAGASPTPSCLLLASRHERGCETIKCLLSNSDAQSFLVATSSSSGKNCLHMASEHGYAENIIQLFHEATPETISTMLHQKDDTDNTPLQSALLNGNEACALVLLRRGARTANLVSKVGVSLLHSMTTRPITAAAFVAVLRRLCDESGNIDELDLEHRSALTCAILNERFDLVSLLTAFGADINGGEGGINPLITATRCNLPQAVRFLVAADAVKKTLDRNAIDSNGETALMIAESEGLTEIAELIAGPKEEPVPEPIVMMDSSTQVQIWDPLLQTNRLIENSDGNQLSHIDDENSSDDEQDDEAECSSFSPSKHSVNCQVNFPPLPPERSSPSYEHKDLINDGIESRSALKQNDGGGGGEDVVLTCKEDTGDIPSTVSPPNENSETESDFPCKKDFEDFSSASSPEGGTVTKKDNSCATSYLGLKFARFICLDSAPSVNEYE